MKYKNYQKIIDFIGTRNIILIEPSSNYRISIKQFFLNMKISKVKVYNDPNEAMLVMNEKNTALIFCEWNIPKMNGLKFCRELRKKENTRKIPFLLMSTENMKQDVVLATEVGIDAYLLKPFSFDEFYQQVLLLCTHERRISEDNKAMTDAEEFIRQKKYNEAIELFKQALELKPESSRARTGLAQIYFIRGEKDLALKYLKESIQYNSQYIDAFKEILKIYEDDGNENLCLSTLLRLHELSPENPTYTLKIANLNLNLKEFIKSEEFFKKTIRLSPRIAAAYKGLGDVYLYQEQYDAAMRQYNKALDIDVSDVSILNSIGLTFVKLGNFSEGIKRYLLALEIEPQNISILFNIGYAYEKIEKYDQALYYFDKALQYQPEYTKAQKHKETVLLLVKKASQGVIQN